MENFIAGVMLGALLGFWFALWYSEYIVRAKHRVPKYLKKYGLKLPDEKEKE